MTTNLFDLIVLTIVGLSGLLSFFRGFVREMMSLGAWVVASVVTLKFLEPASHFVRAQVKSELLSTAIAAIGLFVITLILISIATGMFIKFLKPGEKVGLLDNLAGLAFGVARGVLIVAIIYFVVSKFFADEKSMPDWAKHARTRPFAAEAAAWVGKLTPDYLEALSHKKGGDSDEEDADKDNEKPRKKHEDRDRILTPHRVDAESKAEEEPDAPSSLPSMEDLQRRIREENKR